MSALVGSIGSDVLQNKFFNLVVQPEQPTNSSKPPPKPPKPERKLERRYARHGIHFDRHRLLLPGNRKPKEKEVKNQPVVDIKSEQIPLQISLTPNPSAVLLQCRILHEVRDAEHKALLLQKLIKDKKSNDVNSSNDKTTENSVSIAQVIQLGLVGVFELIRETANQHNFLCCKALQALLHMLQGQSLEGMKNEPSGVLENLFQTLLDLSRLPDDAVASYGDDVDDTIIPSREDEFSQENSKMINNIPSLACSCLLSLIFAWGNTEKLLAVVASFIADCSTQKSPLFIKVPATFIELQRTVLASILEKDHIPTPLQVGISNETMFQSSKVDCSHEDLQILSLQCDGTFLYALFSNSLLLKIGTGYNSTVQGHVYKEKIIADFEGTSHSDDDFPKLLMWFEDSLYFMTSSGKVCLIHRNDLSVKYLFQAPSSNCIWFCGESPWCISASSGSENSFTLKSYTTDGNKFLPKKLLKVCPTKQHILKLGNSLLYEPLKDPAKDNIDIVQVLIGADFALSRTSQGQVYYAGKSESLGLKSKAKNVLSPEHLPLPTSNKISHIAVASDGGHAVIVSETGETYFVGKSLYGEDGETSKNRRQSPQKPRLMKAMEGKKVVSAYCNFGTTALITDKGKLYMFGKDANRVDSKTGLVLSLNDVHVKRVALGKAHLLMMSDDGRIWTAGVNNRGQCGRQKGVVSISQRIVDVELEKDVSMSEDKSMEEISLPSNLAKDAPIAPICSPHKHKWKMDVCVICAVCNECTGYGPRCINSSYEGRYPGMICGCGSGWSGCSECGCCKTCAGEADVSSFGKQKDLNPLGLTDVDFQAPEGSAPFLNKLALLFNQKNTRKGNNSSNDKKTPSKTDPLKEISFLSLSEVQLPKKSADGPAMKVTQIACGDHHSIILTEDNDVYVFGRNNHGQLGVGDLKNRNVPTLLRLPEEITQVACGSQHSLFLSKSGFVYGCGSNTNGQLGELNPGKDTISPQVVNSQVRASWISASQTMSFMNYCQVLLSANDFKKAKLFGNSSFVGILYDTSATSPQNWKSLLIDVHTSQCHHFTDNSFVVTDDVQICIDNSHDTMWSFDASDWSIKSHFMCGYKSGLSEEMLPFSPRLAIPLRHGSLTTRTQAGLNILACLNTLVTKHLQGSIRPKSTTENELSDKPQEKTSEHTVDEYNIVSRFKSHGGGWGYSVHSTEAIRFMTDTDILLGGVGVFGGRGEYTAIVAVFEESGESESIGDGWLMVETDRIPYECGVRDKFHVLFDDPVSITAGNWYTITCKVSGPSSDCGSHGEQFVVSSDNVKFTFRRSKRSNNGTDVSAGQIPELLYTLPSMVLQNEAEVQTKPKNTCPVQTLSKKFYMSFNEGVFDSLPYVMDWARTSLFMDISKKSSRYEDENSIVLVHERMVSDTISNLSFVVFVCLRLLRVALKQITNVEDGSSLAHNYITQCIGLVEVILTDGEIDAALNDALILPSSDRELVVSSSVAMVTECHHVMMDCVDAFYPTPPQKWNYLHKTLENYKTAAIATKSHIARLLVAVFDSLSQSSVDLVQCLPLFPRTFSNLTSVATPDVDTESAASTSTTPSMADSSMGGGFYEVAYSLVEIVCSSAHSAYKYGGETSSSKTHASDGSMFASLLLFPDKALIRSACKLLSTLISSLAYRATDATKLLSPNKQESRVLTVSRFDRFNQDQAWETGNGSTDGICFDVDTDGVVLCGVGVFGGGKKDHNYELMILEKTKQATQSKVANQYSSSNWSTLDYVKGTYSNRDCNTEHIYYVKLSKNIALKKKTQYAVQFVNRGERTHCGENGSAVVTCSDGTGFRFFRFDQCNNGTGVNRGQIPTLLYQRSFPSEDTLASPQDKWVGTATTPVTAGLAYQRHALNVLGFVVESAVEIFKSLTSSDVKTTADSERGSTSEVAEEVDAREIPGESFFSSSASDVLFEAKPNVKERIRSVLSTELVSNLLPELFFHIGVLVRQDPSCAVEVMEIIKTILLPLVELQQIACPLSTDESKTHKLIVESSHPYKAAAVEQYKASFPASVKWMLLEFSPKCQTGQTEDFLQLYLTQNHTENVESYEKSNCLHPVLNKMSQDNNWPQDAILLPGNEVVFALETASDYTNSRDQKPNLFYGFTCNITGYESVANSREHEGANLVNQLINTSGLASEMLIKAHEHLWTDDENREVSNLENLQDRIEHLTAIERTASVTLERHAQLFFPGIHLNSFPTADQALSGNLPICDESNEKLFLQDFISAADETTGGRLARWLQPGSYVDPKQCLLRLDTKSLFQALPTSVSIITRDQYGKPAHVPTLKVELTVKPHPSPLLDDLNVGVVDSPPGVPSSLFETPYEITKYKDSCFHAITMMRSYKKFSFEELRLSYPLKRTLKTENILVAHSNKETYQATWIPSLATTYTLQVTFDDQLKGPSQLVTVAETPHGCTEEPVKEIKEECRLLKFTTRYSRGLRIRSNPTLQSMQIGLLSYGDVIEYCDKLDNKDGTWVKLSPASALDYCKDEEASEAWCVMHHKDNCRTFLVPVNASLESVKEIDRKTDPKSGSQPTNSTKKFRKLTKRDFPSEPVKNPFETNKKSKDFATTFASSIPDVLSSWKESVPGEYKVTRCGKAGHNIRYNPSLKAAPIGKLILGNVFMAVIVKRNKSGVWLLLHKTSLSQFCEDPPDDRHAWTLAVARDGTQHLQLKNAVEQDPKIPTPSVIGHSPFKKVFASEEAKNFPQVNGFARKSSSESRDSALASSPPNLTSKSEDSMIKFKEVSETVIVQKLKTHSEKSSSAEQVQEKIEGPLENGEDRSRSQISSSRDPVRSQSLPVSKFSSTSKNKVQSLKNLFEKRIFPVKSSSVDGADQASKTAINGVNHGDIPFIDEGLDNEGNILSPDKNDFTLTLTNNKEKTTLTETPNTNKERIANVLETSTSQLRPHSKIVSVKSLQRSQSVKSKKNHSSTKSVSPLVAECVRAVFAAFMWHEGIVHDAMACASFLKFNNIERSRTTLQHTSPASTKDSTSQRRSSGSGAEEWMKRDSDPSPATLIHLAMFWDRLSETITKIAIKNQNLPPPAPPFNQNLNRSKPIPIKNGKRFDSSRNGANNVENSKVPPLKRKALAKNDQNLPPPIGRRNLQQNVLPYLHPPKFLGNRDQKERLREMPCDLCDQVCPYPVTYHMSRSHPGCGKFAGGLGYNSSGLYCGGWAGDCGDGGVGGSTWYLLCVTCREKYISQKSPSSQPKSTHQKSKSNWINKLHHELAQPINAHQVMKNNALFLLTLVSASNNSTQYYEQKSDLNTSSKLDVLLDDVEIKDGKILDQADLLPFSTYCSCPFPAIPCTYLSVRGKENGFNNNVRPLPAKNTRSPPGVYRNRSLSNQTTPSSTHFKPVFNQRLSITPDSTPQKTESTVLQRSVKLMRSVSAGPQPLRRRACSGGDASSGEGASGSFLLHNPSFSMKRLMRGKSGNSNNIARDAVLGSPVLPFVTQRHDLKSLESTLHITLRRATLRVYVLQALTWLLRTVVSESSIHDILWYFVSILSSTSSNSGKNQDSSKNSPNDVVDDEIEETKSSYEHPVKGVLSAGMHSMAPVVEAFHGFLQTVSDIMMDLSPNSPVQLLAIRCWSLKVLPSDHQFLHRSKVFSHINQILSKVETKPSKAPPSKLVKVKLNQQNQQYVPIAEVQSKAGSVTCLVDLTLKAQIKTSSHASIANSLTDNSTETFWESGDEDKNKTKHVIISFQDVTDDVKRLCVHIDNTRDLQKKVTSVTLFLENHDDWVKSTVKELTNQFAGWVVFDLPQVLNRIKIELRGPDNGLRVRQIKLLGHSRDGRKYIEQLPSDVLRAQTCEAEVLKVFKLLTAEVFGQLLSEQPLSKATAPSKDGNKRKAFADDLTEEDAAQHQSNPVSPSDVDSNLREHMVGILFSQSKLTSLQKKVFEHTVQAIHVEASHLRKVWESSLEASSATNQSKTRDSDTYCFELLSMILALSGSNVGCHYVAQQIVLIEDFVSLLHIGTPRIQRQITLLLRRVLSEVTPTQLSIILSSRIPCHDKLADNSSPETTSSPVSDPHSVGLLDPFFACIAKALTVQLKGVPDSLRISESKESSSSRRAQSFGLESFIIGRPESGCSTWWLHGPPPDQSTVEEIIKLLLDMSAGKISSVWSSVTKCSISESILALTQLPEERRQPSLCMSTPVMWQVLASLCVLDRDHVEKLSSARSNNTKNKTLLKPNGGFFFDGNKVLVELECKSYKTVYEESVLLPEVCPENPFPMIHTSPFSVGGFAWQIRIFPDGPDESNKGNVALFLHCTTANHLAKVKAKFLIESQPSPAVYEHTFAPNCISEMPSGVAFPNKGDFMDNLKDNQLKVGVVFLSVSEVNEVHVTLSEPNTFPTVCVTPFEDLTGCPWVLKTLQAAKLKLKMDQNEKTTCGLMEFYHRHIMWNATLVSPGSEDISLNVPLNSKGALIGYFGENWSDADVIKSDLVIEDLAITDNPYRIDVDDGYDRYSYISIHVEIVSNHLLYKTPTPSPTGDRERKLLYNARKDRSQIHGRYQDLLRQKALLESKCQNLTRERTKLIGNNEKDRFSQIVPDFSKLLFDIMLDLAHRAIGKDLTPVSEGFSGRPYKPPPRMSDSDVHTQCHAYRENINVLISDSLTDQFTYKNLQTSLKEFKDILVKFIEAKSGIRISRMVVSGSLGMETVCRSRFDADLIMMSSDFPRNGHVMWMPSFVVALRKMLEEGASDQKLPDCSGFSSSLYSIQFQYKSIEIDLYPSYDWHHDSGFDSLYEELLRQRTSDNLSWFCPAAAERQKNFILEQPSQVKELISVVKHWRNTMDWSSWKWRPSSYLLSLLVVRSYENTCYAAEGSLPSSKNVLKSFFKLVMSTEKSRPAPLRISWPQFYDPKDYNIQYNGHHHDEVPPIIQDPANPANNVAEHPRSWMLFRKLLRSWAIELDLLDDGSISDRSNSTLLICENHDDGITAAIVQCNECGNLCSECDRYLHLNKKTRHHQRQIFKEEEEAIQVNLHEGCGRIKLFWLMALADANTLKAVVEFKSRAPGQTKLTSTTGVCRFCGSTSDNGQLAVSNVCSDPVCKENSLIACTRVHPCGHFCGGVKDEEECLRCLHSSCDPGLNQDADDMCMVCFTDALSAAPAIQLSCGHIFHYRCCETQLKKQWTGPRITFGFMLCSICKTEINHPALENYLQPLRDLMSEVERKAQQRLEYEGLSECESITTTGGRFYKDPTGFALSKYAYYMCCKCNKAYYGGEVRCEAEAGGQDLFDPQELICGACSDIFCAQICPKHGTDFLEYKCRYCCSVAVYFCFGTTHFCQPCHDDFQRITALPKNELPHCPAGHKARQLEGNECPLHVQHPATGEEFALGCGVCRNAHTF